MPLVCGHLVLVRECLTSSTARVFEPKLNLTDGVLVSQGESQANGGHYDRSKMT